jgi:hypothetical protein
MKSEEAPKMPPKKPYRRPVLQTYGDIRAITRTVGTNGAMDGGGVKNMNKTA